MLSEDQSWKKRDLAARSIWGVSSSFGQPKAMGVLVDSFCTDWCIITPGVKLPDMDVIGSLP